MNDIKSKWQEIKDSISSLEEDVLKNAKGNKAAGARARKQLRALRNELNALIKISLAKSKEK